MKNYVKKLISSLMAISLAASVFSGIPVFAENSDGTIVDQTQALTVVGKRIKGDDTYFEISLEVNDEHDNYSSVGVVLRYDPDYIIPAESWDEGAGAADMSENTTWATRRALPTLGLETWSTHTALAYQEDTPAPGAAGGKKYGYLYLGAEHPLAVEEPEATADPSATAAPTADPSAPTAEPEATPAPGTRPVVVARFMYKTTAGDATAAPPIVEVTGADMKAKLTEDWTTGTNSSGAAQPTNWDYDWTANKILTIADDDVAGKSPAQYPFAIYTQDYVEKAYMKTWPTVTPTATTAPGDPTPTPMPVSAYAPVIGTGVDAANHLTKDDIMIITCEGESAKSQGGLKLSDIFVILFFDWDNSVIGSLTAGKGIDATSDVNAYVREKFIHPALQTPTTAQLTSTSREDNYRGEYPHISPSSGTTYPDELPTGSPNPDAGSNYPLTNKLEYCIGGRTFYENAPFAGCWTQVTPTTLEDTWTVLTNDDTATRTVTTKVYGPDPPRDEDGDTIDATGAKDPTVVVPKMIAYDFSNVQEKDLDGGVLYVKSVYVPGYMLGRNQSDVASTNYIITRAPTFSMESAINQNSMTYGISFQYERINSDGYGVAKIRAPKINVDLTQTGSTTSSKVAMSVEDGEKMEVFIAPTRGKTETNKSITTVSGLETVGYTLVESYGYNILSSTARSLSNGNDGNSPFKNLKGADQGFIYQATLDKLIEFYETKSASAAKTAMTWIYFRDMGLIASGSATSATEFKSSTTMTNPRTRAYNLIKWAVDNGQDPHELTYYQFQWAILKNANLDAATARTNCINTYKKWCPFNE